MILDTLAQKIEDLEAQILKNNEKEVVGSLENIEIFAKAISGSSGLEGAFSEHLTLNINTIEAYFFEEQNDLAILGSSELSGFVDGVRFVYEPSIKKQILRTYAANAQEAEDYLNEGDKYHTNSKIRYFMGFASGVELALNHTSEGNDYQLIANGDNPEDMYQGFEFNPSTDSLKIDGHEIDLNFTELELLKYFIKNKDTKLGRQQIMDGAWKGRVKESGYNTTMRNLRKKIQPTLLGPQFIIPLDGGSSHRFSMRLDSIYRPKVQYDPESKEYKIGDMPIEFTKGQPKIILDEICENGSDGTTARTIVDKVWSPQDKISVLVVPMSALRKTLSDANPYQPCPLYLDGQTYKVIGFK